MQSKSKDRGLNVQYGAGWTAVPGWLNFDGSPSVKLERLPLVGKLLRINSERFPDEILYGNIIAGLPIASGSAKAIYASHVLEHLTEKDCRRALRNTLDVLIPGGTFRLVVPDLAVRAQVYLARLAEKDAEAGNDFCRSTMLGIPSKKPGLTGWVRDVMGNSHHLWMWDELSMAAALKEAGFLDIRRCDFGDAADPDFRAVEDETRFFDKQWNVRELAMEAKRPL